MKHAQLLVVLLLSIALLVAAAPSALAHQSPEVKFVADSVVVQADGTYETDPDLATVVFSISSQDKELKKAYETATQSMQRIIALADNNGLKKADVSTGALRLTPSYDRDHKGKPKSYTVQGDITLRVHDFSQIGALLDGAVEDNIVYFRSLTYSLQDEEAAKERAVGEAMRHAVARASAALTESGQKLGTVRYANVDVSQLARLEVFGVSAGLTMNSLQLDESVQGGGGGLFGMHKAAAPPLPPPPVQPGKITVSAAVQCAFAIK